MANKKSSLTKTVDSLKKMGSNSSINAETVAKGAAGVAIVAGMVAAGAALSDEKTRNKLGKGAQDMMHKVSDVASNIQEESKKYQAASHNLNISKKSSGKKT